MEAEPKVRLCMACMEWKPLDQFRRRQKDSERRHYDCRDCANAYMRERRRHQRQQKFDDALVQLHRDRDSPGKLEYLAAVLMAAFDGAFGFAAEYARALDAARDAGDHKAVQRYMLGFVDLMYVAAQSQSRRNLAEAKRKRKRTKMLKEAKRWNDFEDELVPWSKAE